MNYKFKVSRQRSLLMQKIKSRDTKPERVLRKKLWGMGYRFSRKQSNLPGRPDIVLKKYKIAIFVDGEFWHGYNWKEKKKAIKANRSYWIPKLERNILRDKNSNKALRKDGWIVIRFWQREIDKQFDLCVRKVLKGIKDRGKKQIS